MGSAAVHVQAGSEWPVEPLHLPAGHPTVADRQRYPVGGLPAAEGEPRVVGYQPVGDDGIAASPKLREQLNEREAAVQIAPLQ